MNKNIDLTKILKDCPEGFELYSSLHGKVIFSGIDENSLNYPIDCTDYKGSCTSFTKEGYLYKMYPDAECVLFPSKDQRDWSKFTAPWYKKEKFDPKSLQPFDKVLVRDFKNDIWKIDFYSCNKRAGREYPYECVRSIYSRYCIPYNEDTKRLVGTANEPPEYYKYWEN